VNSIKVEHGFVAVQQEQPKMMGFLIFLERVMTPKMGSSRKNF